MNENVITIERPDVAAIKAEYSPLVEAAHQITITSVEEHEVALRHFKLLHAGEKAVGAKLDPICNGAYSVHKMLTKLRAEALGPLQEARVIVGRKIAAWTDEQKRIAEEKQRAEEAQRLADEEAARAAARASVEAIAPEATPEVVEQVTEEVLAALPPAPQLQIVKPDVAKVEGVSSRKVWHAEVTDFDALVAWVADNDEWTHLLLPNMTALNTLARDRREKLQIPGLRAVCETIMTARS